jgi:hypothetical protein
MNRPVLTTMVTLFLIGLLAVAVPQQSFGQIMPKQQAQPDEQQLRSFAKVYVQVEKIRQTYEPRAKEAAGAEEGKQIQQEAQAKFQDALTKEGLSEQNYLQIFQVAKADQDVRKKVLELIDEERGKS